MYTAIGSRGDGDVISDCKVLVELSGWGPVWERRRGKGGRDESEKGLANLKSQLAFGRAQ